jgi:hypothetical protein
MRISTQKPIQVVCEPAFFKNLWRSSHAAAIGALSGAGDDNPLGFDFMEPAELSIRTPSVWRLAKVSDQERWINEILDILGLPRDTPHREFTRGLVERGASLQQIYGALQSRVNSRLA